MDSSFEKECGYSLLEDSLIATVECNGADNKLNLDNEAPTERSIFNFNDVWQKSINFLFII